MREFRIAQSHNREDQTGVDSHETAVSPCLVSSNSELLNGSPAEYLSPRNQPGISQNDEHERPGYAPGDIVGLTTH